MVDDITLLEDALIAAVTDLNLFAVVDSAGRDAAPAILTYPYASVFFLGDGELARNPRPIDEVRFGIMVSAQNFGGEADAAKDAYVLIFAVRDCLRGKTLGVDGIEPFGVRSRDLVSYEDNVLTYLITAVTKIYQPIPTPD